MLDSTLIGSYSQAYSPMNKLLIAALGLMPATSLWAALPPQVEADRHVLRAQQELKAGAMDQALAEFALAEKQGSLDKTVTLPEGFYTGYATALAQSGKTAQARQVLENYLNKYRNSGSSYQQALAQYVALDQPAGSAPVASVAVPRNCARAELPFALDESVWRALESSLAYQSSTVAKNLTLVGEKTEVTKGKAFVNQTSEQQERRFTALNPCVLQTRLQQTTSFSNKVVFSAAKVSMSTLTSSAYSTLGGLLLLGSESGGEVANRLKALEDVTGSLFPLQTGNKLHLVASYQLPQKMRLDCSVVGQMPASGIDRRLTGNAWRIDCTSVAITDGPGQQPVSSGEARQSSRIFLEDTGLMINELQQVQMENGAGRLLIPTPQTRGIPRTRWR